MAHQQHNGITLFGETGKRRRAFAHLRHTARRRGDAIAVQHLHRIDDHYLRPLPRRMIQNGLQLGFRQQLQFVCFQLQTLGPHRHLLQGFLTRHVERRNRLGQFTERLQQQCAFARPRMTANQHR